MELVEQVRADLDGAPVSPTLRAPLRIAGAVQVSGRNVMPELIGAARDAGASDLELHDTVRAGARRPRQRAGVTETAGDVADRRRSPGQRPQRHSAADQRRPRGRGTDLEIHDAVLIAAAFCMFNRYVDGLGTLAPDDPQAYAYSAKSILEHGYRA